jgi:hypothetical protein
MLVVEPRYGVGKLMAKPKATVLIDGLKNLLQTLSKKIARLPS